MERKRYFINGIREALDEKLAEDDKVILLGEDICDPFGGCFRVTQGLSTKYPQRVKNMPISEAGIMGLATGLAMQGFKPIVEIMFFDFMLLCADQLFNHAVKFHKHWQPINLTIRTVIGKPDYGFQHTQDLTKIFKEMVTIIKPTPSEDVKALYKEAINSPFPILIVEDSKFYWEKI